MDARASLIAIGLAAACAPKVRRWDCPARPPVWTARVLSRGTLAYAAELRGDTVAAIELDTRFALVVHDAASGAERARIDLGPAAPDLDALALSDDAKLAWVGGKDEQVRTIDVATRTVTQTWPIGAPVTALAAIGDDYVAVGDATGALCLRRRDGALLQCVAVADAAIARLSFQPWLEPGTLDAVVGDRLIRYEIPSLQQLDATAAPRYALPAGVVKLGGAIRDIHPTPSSGLVIAAWIRTLDDPSVVVAEDRVSWCDL